MDSLLIFQLISPYEQNLTNKIVDQLLVGSYFFFGHALFSPFFYFVFDSILLFCLSCFCNRNIARQHERSHA